MVNHKIACRIPGSFCQPHASLQNIAPKSMRTLPHVVCRQPIRGIVYLHVLNRRRRAARQLLFVVDNACAVVTSNLASKNITLS
jgi:hypothetical protein